MKRIAIILFMVAIIARAVQLAAPTDDSGEPMNEGYMPEFASYSTDDLILPISTIENDLQNFGNDLGELGGLLYTAVTEPIIPAAGSEGELTSEKMRKQLSDSIGVQDMIDNRKNSIDQSVSEVF